LSQKLEVEERRSLASHYTSNTDNFTHMQFPRKGRNAEVYMRGDVQV